MSETAIEPGPGTLPPGPDGELLYFVRGIGRPLALRVLLLLCEGPDSHWTPVSVGLELGCSARAAAKALVRLYREGLLDPTDHGYRYSPRSPHLAHACRRLRRLIPDGDLATAERLVRL